MYILLTINNSELTPFFPLQPLQIVY